MAETTHPTDHAGEFQEKLARLRRMLSEHGADALLLASVGNFAWITGGGRSHVSIGSERGCGAVLVTADEAFLIADNIELARLLEEETGGLPLNPVTFDWWTGGLEQLATGMIPAGRLIADVAIPGSRPLTTADGIALRTPLLPGEVGRYRLLGERVGIALTHAVLHSRPGLSEHQLAELFCGPLRDFGIDPLVALVAADERASSRRHPLPTERRLERYALLVVTAREGGLHASATRSVHFGAVPAELAARHAACVRVQQAFHAATRPGAAISAAFAAGAGAYAAEGYPDEWRRHHQGGPAGYHSRDAKATPTAPGNVLLGQAFAWNPTITGAKAEDTILVTADGYELLTTTPDVGSLTER